MAKKTRMEELEEEARRVGLYVTSYSPGDGVTRYRFTREPADYFAASGANKLYTALGLKEARTFIEGFGSGRSRRKHAARSRR